MAVSNSPSTVTNGLVLCLDAANRKSYPGSGTIWTDLSGRGNNGTLVNGVGYNSANLGSLSFDGVNDYVSSTSDITLGNTFSISLWVKHNISLPVQERYISLGNDKISVSNNQNGDLNLYVTNASEQNLWTWGYGKYGQLGNNSTTDRGTPITTFSGGTNWKQVSCGVEFISALKTDGTLWTWGRNQYGQLGTNDITNRSTPVTTFAGGTNWKQVSCEGTRSSAIKTDGTLWTWGRNLYGNLGINNTTNRSTPVTTFAGGTNWKQVGSGYFHTVAIKTDGTLWTWGSGIYGQLGTNDTTNRFTPVTTFTGGTNWKSVGSGYNHVAAIKTDGTLWTWGYGSFGQLGNNSTTNRFTPVTTFAGGTDWKQVGCGNLHTATIKTDGTLWTWGQGSSGQLGTTSTSIISRSTPVTTFAGGTNWKQVGCGSDNVVSIKTDGTLWVWGWGNAGQLGNGSINNRYTPVTTFAGGTNWKQVSAGGLHTSAIKTDAVFINDMSVSTNIVNTNFYNIVATSNGTTLTLYQNGTSVATETLNGTLNSSSLSYTISSALEAFNGNVYNVMVYDRALTASEVQQNYNALKGRFGLT